MAEFERETVNLMGVRYSGNLQEQGAVFRRLRASPDYREFIALDELMGMRGKQVTLGEARSIADRHAELFIALSELVEQFVAEEVL